MKFPAALHIFAPEGRVNMICQAAFDDRLKMLKYCRADKFVEPVSESDAIENIVYEFLLKSGKSLNIHIEKENSLFRTNHSELILLLEEVTQKANDDVISEKSNKDFDIDKLFNGKDQLKTNNLLGMKDVGIEFNTRYQCLKR